MPLGTHGSLCSTWVDGRAPRALRWGCANAPTALTTTLGLPLAMAGTDTAQLPFERPPPKAAFRVIHWQERIRTDRTVMFSQTRYTRGLWTRLSADDGGGSTDRISSVSCVFSPKAIFIPASAGFFFGALAGTAWRQGATWADDSAPDWGDAGAPSS